MLCDGKRQAFFDVFGGTGFGSLFKRIVFSRSSVCGRLFLCSERLPAINDLSSIQWKKMSTNTKMRKPKWEINGNPARKSWDRRCKRTKDDNRVVLHDGLAHVCCVACELTFNTDNHCETKCGYTLVAERLGSDGGLTPERVEAVRLNRARTR